MKEITFLQTAFDLIKKCDVSKTKEASDVLLFDEHFVSRKISMDKICILLLQSAGQNI